MLKVFRAISLLFLLAAAGCATTAKPVLYPNAHLKIVGQSTADKDIAECQNAAEFAGAESSKTGGTGEVAKQTAGNTAIGAASGAVGGAILGSPGAGAAAGAVSGATWGILRGIFSGVGGSSSQASAAYTGYMTRCLKDKGYDVTGWE